MMKRDLFNSKKLIDILGFVLILVPSIALAEEGAHTGNNGLIGVGAGIAIGLAALGGALGQGKAVSSNLEATGRNPGASGKLFTPMILGLALIESLVILSFVIAYTLAGKV